MSAFKTKYLEFPRIASIWVFSDGLPDVLVLCVIEYAILSELECAALIFEPKQYTYQTGFPRHRIEYDCGSMKLICHSHRNYGHGDKYYFDCEEKVMQLTG
jgi:hypothetical protein